MHQHRTEILDWIAQGRLRPENWATALRLAGTTPDTRDWRKFLDQLMLWLGTTFCAVAVIFFFAYNWTEMGRFAKFGLVEILIVGGLAMYCRLEAERPAGKATLLLATLLVGALLALVGQTYQTGADTYELFGVWASAVLVWVLIARLGALWLLWLALVNLAVYLYSQTFGGLWGMLFRTEEQIWTFFILNTGALVIWEAAARSGATWLNERWSLRILGTVSGALVTMLMLWALFDAPNDRSTYATAAYVGWMLVAYLYYRHVVPDLFMLAGGVLSGVIVITSFLAIHILDRRSAGGFLLIGLVVIGLSAAGGVWLKSVASGERA